VLTTEGLVDGLTAITRLIVAAPLEKQRDAGRSRSHKDGRMQLKIKMSLQR